MGEIGNFDVLVYLVIILYLYVTVSGKTGIHKYREMVVLNIQGVVACQWW